MSDEKKDTTEEQTIKAFEKVANQMIRVLSPLSREAQIRVLRAAACLLDIDIPEIR